MQTLQQLLTHDANDLTKKQIIELLRGVQQAITPAAYQRISGLDPETELDKLRKPELVAIVEDLRDGYDVSWESGLSKLEGRVRENLLAIAMAYDESFDDADLRASGASDADFAAELGSIDFAKLIGGPMDAAVKAQANASVSTVDFIQAVGFEGEGPTRTLRMVDFSYESTGTDDQGNPVTESKAIVVPFIAMLNVPALRIETLDIDVNVKLNSTYTKDVSTTLGLDAKFGYGFGPVKFEVSASLRRSSATGIKVEKEYSMNVKVKATNDEMPAGLERVMGMLAA